VPLARFFAARPVGREPARRWPLALLLLAALSFGLSWWTNERAAAPGAGQPAAAPDAARLQARLSVALGTAAHEAGRVARAAPLEVRASGDSSAQPSEELTRRLADCTYPTFVAVGGQLLGWSASGPAPTAADLADPRPEWLTPTDLGDFVVRRQALGAAVVLVYVPLTRRYGISNRYLSEESAANPPLLAGLRLRAADSTADSLRTSRSADQFADQPDRTAEKPVSAATVLRGSDGRPLLRVEAGPGAALPARQQPLGWLLLGSAAYAAGWLGLAWGWWRRGRGAAAALALAGPLLVWRLALLALGLPDAWVELPLFDPRVYAVSGWAPSLGDLLLNGLIAALLAGAAALLARHYGAAARARLAPGRWGALGLAVLLLAVLSLRGYYAGAFSNAQLSLDLTLSARLSGLRAVLALAVLLYTGALTAVLYEVTGWLRPLLARLPRRPALAVGLALAGGWLMLSARWPLALPIEPGLVALYLWLLVLGTAASGTRGINEMTTLAAGSLAAKPTVAGAAYGTGWAVLGSPRAVLALGLLLSAALGATALYTQFERQLGFDKQRLASNLLTDNDLQGEFLLGQRMRQLGQDPAVARLFASAPVRTDALRRRAGQYLHHYFDKYEQDIDLFAADGRVLAMDDNDTLSFERTRERLSQTATATDQPGIYLLKSDNSFSSRRYVAVVPVGLPPSAGIGPPAPVGTILITLRLRQLASYSVLPELLVDQKFFQPGLATDLSYAGYADGQLVVSQGDFDYANQLPPSLLRDPQLYATGLRSGGFHHLAVREASGHRVVVVTTDPYSGGDWFANFSFLLLLQALGWAVVLSTWQLMRRTGQRRLTFGGRVQLLLNVGILVPLLVVSAAVASQVVAGYQRDLRRTYERRGRVALESLSRYQAAARRPVRFDTTARLALTVLVGRVAALTETDLDLYDADGRLLASSQPFIFEAGLLGPLLNPQALLDLRQRGLSRSLRTEQAGSLAFTSLYLPVRAPAATEGGPPGAVLGFVGIPFFDSQKELDTKLTELFTTILSIFTIMLGGFLVLALWATRRLTAPLQVLTQRLTRTTLTGQNEALLDYGGSQQDEIGLLVGEYNAMLGKLAASRRALAAQEKEAAWREMARQVAHEIKNPLTPMKLSLQYLQKAIAERRPNAEELIARIAQTLLTQIDVLADIATSFSTFTNLPAMRPTRLDVGQVLRQCAELFGENAAGEASPNHLLTSLPHHPVIVFADESLLVRTFNNLLLNARQAVPPGRVPRLSVSLTQADGQAHIRIQDNGSGIAEAVRERVFLPNFTTKASGSGIGLAVARRGIESAGGRLWFETEEGVGTTFFIELPLAG